MTRRTLKRVLSFAKAAGDFVMHIVHAPTGGSTPDPAKAAAKAAAKQMKDAMHVRGAGTGGPAGGFSGSSAADGLYGKVLADGHKKARKKA